uniref:Calcium/calmodulin-dependent protein kinase II association-domain domain-containing protein n=1 Tax=Romanomermis culicivorax TaxID=13658 RepID=A0A915HPA5_ROMCU
MRKSFFPAGTSLKHENTVVHVETNSTATPSQNVPLMTTATTCNTYYPQANSELSTPTTPGVTLGRKLEILKATETIVEALYSGNSDVYMKLCDPGITSFQEESYGNLVEGLDFHKFCFDNVHHSGKASKHHAVRCRVLNPCIHLMGDDHACIAYSCLVQYLDNSGVPSTCQSQETRLWQKRDGKWLCIHTHRSGTPFSTVLAKIRNPACQ